MTDVRDDLIAPSSRVVVGGGSRGSFTTTNAQWIHRNPTRRAGPPPRDDHFLYPFIEGNERDPGALLTDLAARPTPRRRRACASGTPAARHAAPNWSEPPPRWPSGSGTAPGSSPSVTGAARLTPPVWPRFFRRPRAAGPSPPALSVADEAVAHRPRQRRRVRAGVLPPAHRLRPIRGHRLGSCRRAATRSTSSTPSPRPGGAGCSPSAWPATTAGRWPRPGSTTVWSCMPTASTASRKPRRRWSSSCGRRSRASWTRHDRPFRSAGPTLRRPGLTGRRRRPPSSTASRASGAGAPDSPTRSSRSPTAPGARRRPA